MTNQKPQSILKKSFLSLMLPIFLLVISPSFAFAQSTDDLNFDDLFEELDKELTEVSDRSVLDSTHWAVNPRVKEICDFIENSHVELFLDVLGDKKSIHLEKSELGKYYSLQEVFTDFQCRQFKYGGISYGVDKRDNFTVPELSILHLNKRGVKIISYILESIKEIPAANQLAIIQNKNSDEDLISFISTVMNVFESELNGVGLETDVHDLTFTVLKNVNAELVSIKTEALSTLSSTPPSPD